MKTSTLPKPLHDRVIVSDPPLPPKSAERKIDGIIIPADVKGSTIADIEAPYYEAKVLAVGGDCKATKKGDRVVVPRRDLFAVRFGERAVTMVREANIVAVL